MLNPKYIIIHHSLTKDSGTVSYQAIRRYHMETLGWTDIGYHFVIEKVNDTYEIIVGRSMLSQGAHCRDSGRNRDSLGICVVGNFDIAAPSMDQWKKTLQVTETLCNIFNIPSQNVRGHNEYSTKSCPGKFFNMPLFRRYLVR